MTVKPSAGDIDFPKRLSLVSGGSQVKDAEGGYAGNKTPEGGALREGGMPVLTSKENIGLLFQYVVVGLARINYSSPNEGVKYVIIMLFCAVGYVLSDVCADAITCELAQGEPIDKRGKTQSCIYTVRTAMVIFGEILVGFFFNGEDYGGGFDFSLSFPQLMIIVAVLTLPVFPMTWFFIKEEKAEAANF
ncbi:hypothetical protein PInf_008579 [Phytophthora infestans]|nr:hypothetical protein PInf_008579 [Phytophthora infestans]